jgi:chorismate dehydratase
VSTEPGILSPDSLHGPARPSPTGESGDRIPGSVLTADGSWTLVHPGHGEAYHSLAGAWTQARERYARAARVRERARELAAQGLTRLRLLDVGTGMGLNLAAALEALEGTGVALDAVSLEVDPAILARAASGPREPASLERWHAPVRAALAPALVVALADPIRAAREGLPLPGLPAELERSRLRLLLGDARQRLSELPRAPGFDAVFLDPFSPRVEPALWQADFLREVAARLAPGSLLSTYSAAVRVRAALAAAGLAVGPGPAVGTKREGTLASPDRDVGCLPPRLARRLAARAERVRAGFGAREGDPEALFF